MAALSTQVAGTGNATWTTGAQVEYQSYIATNATYYTFKLTGNNTATGLENASWNVRPYNETFYLLFTPANITAFKANSSIAGSPATGTSSFGGKSVTWINVTNVFTSAAFTTTYLKSLNLTSSSKIYCLIDSTTGIVVELGTYKAPGSTQQVVLKLNKWPDAYFPWSIFMTVLAAILGILLFVALFRFGLGEMKYAPQKKFKDKAGTYFSSFVLAGIVTAVVLFVVMIILQAIFTNWLLTLQNQVPTNPGTRPLGQYYQVDLSILQALEWGKVIPVLIVLMGVYVCLYPFYDLLKIPKRGSDKPMEIQQAMETHVMGKVPFPLGYFIAAGILAVGYLLPTYFIFHIFAPKILVLQGNFDLTLFTIAIAWFIIPALIFLDYYASIGMSLMFWTGWTRGFKSKNPVENTFNIILFVIAAILVISSTYNFASSLSDLLSGKLPSIVAQNTTTGLDHVLAVLITFFIKYLDFWPWKATDLWKFQQFTTVIPFDLLFFFITVVTVGLYGFWSKFLSKEPLNRPALVSFAAYIVAAAGFQAFINVVVRLPDSLAGSIFIPPFTNPNGYAYGSAAYIAAYYASFGPIRQLFFITYFCDKTFIFCFLIYNLLINKKLRINVSERILAIAVMKDQVDILSNFTTSKDRRTQQIVLDNAYRIVKKNPGESKKIVKMVRGFIVSEDETLNALANKVLLFLSTILPIEDLEPTFLAGVSSPSEFVREAIETTIVKIGKDDPEKIVKLYGDIVTSELPDATLELLASCLEQLRKIRPEVPGKVLLPFLDLLADAPRGGGLKILKHFNVLNLTDKRGEVIPKLTRIVTEKSESQAEDTIELLGILGTSDPEKMDTILARLEEISGKASAPVKKRIIRAEVAFLVATPERATTIFPDLFRFLNDISPEVRGEVGLGMGQVGKIFKKGENFQSIRKIISKLLNDFDEEVRADGVKALAEVGKANPKLLLDPEFKEMLEVSINEPSDLVRQSAVDLFVQFSKAAPSLNLFLLPLRILGDPNASKSHITALQILDRIIRTFPKEGGIDLVLNPVLEYDRKDEKVRVEIAGILEGVAKIRPEKADRIFPVLQELSKDQSEAVAATVTTAVEELALAKIANPGLQMSVTVDALVDIIVAQCIGRKTEALAAAIQSANRVYAANKAIHTKLYPVFLQLRKNAQPAVLQQVIPMLDTMVTENKSEYSGKKIATELLPALLETMQKASADVKNALATAIDAIVATFSETAIEVSAFLVNAARKEKAVEARVMAISALGKFPGVAENVTIAHVLVRNTLVYSSSQIRRAAHESIRDFISELPTSNLTTKQKMSLMVLAGALLKTWTFLYMHDLSVPVRKAYTEALSALGTNQAFFAKKVLQKLSIMALDKDSGISLYAAQEFFNILHQHPDLAEKTTQENSTIGLSPHTATRKLMYDETQALIAKKAALSSIIQPLLVLAGGDDDSVRDPASDEFQMIVSNTPGEVTYLKNMLLEMARDTHAQVREGAAHEIVGFVAKHPYKKDGQEQLLQAFLELARDPVKSVRSTVALRIAELANLIPADQVNVICQALFRLIREDERTTKNNVVEGFRVVFSRFPDIIHVCLSDLIQVDRKENLLALDDLIQEYTQATGMAAPSLSFADGMVKLVNVMTKEFEKIQAKRKKKQKKAEKKAAVKEEPPKEGPAPKKEEVAVKKEEPAEKKAGTVSSTPPQKGDGVSSKKDENLPKKDEPVVKK
jgi:hypothetical protein